MPANKNPNWRDKLSIIRHQIGMRGVRRTIADVLVFYFRYMPEWDLSFDRRYGTDTAGFVPPTALGIPDEIARKAAVLYLPSPEDVTRWMLDQLTIDPSSASFVDYGCGKGRVVLIASEYRFSEVVGVEISEQLASIARKNLEVASKLSRKCEQVWIACEDARYFELPPGNLVVHFYHPFSEDILRSVLGKLVRHAETGARVDVVYLLPTGVDEVVEAVFSQFPTFRALHYYQSASTDYDWLFFSSHPERS